MLDVAIDSSRSFYTCDIRSIIYTKCNALSFKTSNLYTQIMAGSTTTLIDYTEACYDSASGNCVRIGVVEPSYNKENIVRITISLQTAISL